MEDRCAECTDPDDPLEVCVTCGKFYCPWCLDPTMHECEEE